MTTPAALPDVLFDTDALPWTCAQAKGVSYKSLRYEGDTHSGAVLVHMCPETVYPENLVHKGMDIFVLDGEISIATAHLPRGSYAHVAPGAHTAPSTREGCVLFVTFPGRVENIHS